MKRRRKVGKKGKVKKTRTVSTNEVAQRWLTSHIENNPATNEFDTDEFDSCTKSEPPPSTGADFSEKPPLED